MYEIIDLKNSEYSSLVIIRNEESALNYLKPIYEELMLNNVEGKVIIDEILHVANSEKRFIEFEIYSNSSYEDLKTRFVKIKKDSVIRKISCEYLRNHNLSEYSILSSIQKKMINAGIAI